MTATPPPASHQLDDGPVFRTAEIGAFFSQLTDSQARFVRAVSDAAAWLDGESIEIAELAAVQARLTQQLFDAQRSILRRRVDVEARANGIATRAEDEAQGLVEQALADAAAVCGDLDEVTAFGDVLALRRDGRSPTPSVPIERAIPGDRESDVDTAERQLRALLDEWWRLEVERGQATLDEAEARAAVCLHLAEIEAGEIRETARAVNEAGNTLDELARRDLVDTGASDPNLGERPEPTDQPDTDNGSDAAPAAVVVSPLPISPPPMVWELGEALDVADQAGLDALLASFLEALRDPPADVDTSNAHADEASNATADQSVAGAPSGPMHGVVSPDAFDRFWGSGHGRGAQRGSREWVFVQILLPMVAIVAVLALVLAWIG